MFLADTHHKPSSPHWSPPLPSSMEVSGPFHRDVEKELLSKKRELRRPHGEAIYCFPYTKEMVDFDNWDLMFHTKYCFRDSLTMHQFETPPQMVLDLGCGSGLWVIEAAKQWKETKIVGFEFLADLPPRKGLPEDIAQRIEWVQGNFLEPFPFPSNHFDFVRGIRLSFHVPEDESSILLDEVYRVIKPGGVLESIEEDLIFPHARMPSESCTAASEISHKELIFPVDNSPMFSFIDFTPPLAGSTGYTNSSSQETLFPFDSISRRSTVNRHSTTPRQSEKQTSADPRDHSRLQKAWDLMLQKRFLVPFKAHPLLQVPLPPSSSARDNISLNFSHPSTRSPGATVSSPPPPTPSQPSSENMDTQRFSQKYPWASMHLARTVRTVIGCKENMWEAYHELYGDQSIAPPVLRPSHGKNSQYAVASAAVRDAFEMDWSNWESDMQDRIGFRGNIHAELLWREPSGDTPDWRVWRNSVTSNTKDEDVPREINLCRSMRAIVGFKPA